MTKKVFKFNITLFHGKKRTFKPQKLKIISKKHILSLKKFFLVRQIVFSSHHSQSH